MHVGSHQILNIPQCRLQGGGEISRGTNFYSLNSSKEFYFCLVPFPKDSQLTLPIPPPPAAAAFVRRGHRVVASSRTDYSAAAAKMGAAYCPSAHGNRWRGGGVDGFDGMTTMP